MGADSKIEWTHHTFNPWWGCTRVSPGCEHCYAETFAKRVGQKVWGVQAERRFFGDAHWAEPLKWNAAAGKAGVRRRVFCASMADVFEDRRELDAQRARLFALIHSTPHLDWLLLTKRPENMERLASATWINGWPANVWAGCTVEDQQRADERIPHLLGVPAAVRFLSVEPMLGPVNIRRWMGPLSMAFHGTSHKNATISYGVDWVIVGGESGPGARPFNVEWARSIVSQCREYSVAVHVKQMGAVVVDRNDRFNTCQDTGSPSDWWPLDDPDRVEENINGFREEYQGAPVRIRLLNRKGGDWNEWPPDLRIREYPVSK